MTRILGVDPGERRIGIALTDPHGMIASPHTVIDRRTQDVAATLLRICEENEVTLIVVGLPTGLSGHAGPAVDAARAVADIAAEATAIPVVFQDERFTTVTAEAALLEGGVKRDKRRDVRDKVAAAVILQSYLDRKGYERDDA